MRGGELLEPRLRIFGPRLGELFHKRGEPFLLIGREGQIDGAGSAERSGRGGIDGRSHAQGRCKRDR